MLAEHCGQGAASSCHAAVTPCQRAAAWCCETASLHAPLSPPAEQHQGCGTWRPPALPHRATVIRCDHSVCQVRLGWLASGFREEGDTTCLSSRHSLQQDMCKCKVHTVASRHRSVCGCWVRGARCGRAPGLNKQLGCPQGEAPRVAPRPSKGKRVPLTAPYEYTEMGVLPGPGNPPGPKNPRTSCTPPRSS